MWKLTILIVAISGASGAVYGLRLLHVLKEMGVEVHLIVSPAGGINLRLETKTEATEVFKLAKHSYDVMDLAATISSGSFRTDGMVIVPCSTKTLSAVANGFSDNLITRAADVCLKEKRPLVLVPRETPLSEIHLRNMSVLARAGAVILPACPGFYHRPSSVDELVDQVVWKILDVLGIESSLVKRWHGLPPTSDANVV